MIKWIGAVVVVVAVVAIGYWLTQCPCERISGAWLQGDEVTTSIDDWTFANDTPICYVEVPGIIPHSITLNCMSAEERLYLSCSQCDGKHWSTVALEEGYGRIRIGESVYPISFTRVTNEAELDLAWTARAGKLARLRGRDMSEIPVRPGHWWSFRLASMAPASS